MKIRDEILSILAMCLIEENVVYLPKVQLERKAYLEVNKHLEHLGGKWNRKAKGHVFDEDPTDSFENMLLTGETTDFKKEFQFFETPAELAKKLVEMADIGTDHYILEPSAGRGAIAKQIDKGFLFCNEINPEMANYLINELNISVSCSDFLKFTEQESGIHDRVIMNPPFTKQQDIDHIMHAYSLLSPGGILVSIVSESPFFRENNKSIEFRKFLEDTNAEVIKNPEGTFKSSGTMVRTRLIKIKKA